MRALMRNRLMLIFAVILATCFASVLVIVNKPNLAKADIVSGTAPILSEKTMINVSTAKENEKAMLIATGIANYGDVYEIGYTLTVKDDEDNDITGTITKYSVQTVKYYTAIVSGDNTFTAESLFGESFDAMIIWEIEYDKDYSFNFTSYAKYGDRDDSGKLVYNPSSEKSVQGVNKVVESKTVTFNTNGGSAVASQKVEYGTRLSSLLPINSTKAGYDATWQIGGVDITGNEKITSDITLTANWELNVSYNPLSYASNLLGYSWYNELGADGAYSQGGFLTDGVYTETGEHELGNVVRGLTGNYVRFSVGAETRHFGITLPSSRTLADITALRDMGYAYLQFNVYVYYQHNDGTEFTYKACNILTDAEVAGLNGTAKNIAHNQFTTIYIPIDNIIAKYDKLQDHTTAMLFVNAGDGIDGVEHGDNVVWVYIGNMNFISVAGDADDYNPLLSTTGITGYSWYNEGGNVGYDGYRISGTLVENVAGVAGNYIRFLPSDTSGTNGTALQDFGIKMPSTKSKAEIQALKAAGYTKLSIAIYVGTEYSSLWHKNISFIVDAYSRTGVAAAMAYHNMWTVVKLDIDDIIDNYDALQDGSKALIYVWNRDYVAPAGLTADGADTQPWALYISELQFVKDEAYVERADDYNPLSSADDIKGYSWYREEYNGGNIGFDGYRYDGTVVEGMSGNAVYFTRMTGASITDFGIVLPSTKSLSEIQALKAAGYTKLSITVYMPNDYAADKTVAKNKHVSFIAKTNYDGNTALSAVYSQYINHNEFTTIELDIDDIIDNYAYLQAGTKALVYISANATYGDTDAGANSWGIYISDLHFI